MVQGNLKSLLKPILTKQLLKKAAPKNNTNTIEQVKIKKRLPMSNPPKPLTEKERNKEIQRLEDYNKYLDSLLKDAISRM